MQTKPKFISEPVIDNVTPFHQYSIELNSKSSINKAEFNKLTQYKKFLEFLAALRKNSSFFADSNWYFLQFDMDDPEAVYEPIFLEENQQKAMQYLSQYHIREEIDAFKIPSILDYNLRDHDQTKQHLFSAMSFFKDKNILELYDQMTFTYVEYYNSTDPDKSPALLETIIKTMALHCDRNDFSIVSLYDNDFIGRRAPNYDEKTYFAESYQVYPHRLICAWKCIVKGDFTSSDIPQASKVDNFSKGYTLVSTLDDHEYFSSYNADHIYKANQVEIRLKELGVLPYFKTD